VLNDQLNPTELNFSQLQYWLEYPRGGNCELRGPGSLNWMPEPIGKPSSDHVALATKLSRENTLSLQLANLLFPLIKKLPPSWTKVRTAPEALLNADLRLLLNTHSTGPLCQMAPE
jgi:hypothetical protein